MQGSEGCFGSDGFKELKFFCHWEKGKKATRDRARIARRRGEEMPRNVSVDGDLLKNGDEQEVNR